MNALTREQRAIAFEAWLQLYADVPKQDVAAFLGLRRGTVYRWTSRGARTITGRLLDKLIERYPLIWREDKNSG